MRVLRVLVALGAGLAGVAKLAHGTMLVARDAAENDAFGFDVSISGNTAFVGAPNDRQLSGSVYIFEGNNVTWTQIAKFSRTTPVQRDFFGISVSVDGDVGAIGAYGVGTSGTGLVFVLEKTGGNWNGAGSVISSVTRTFDSFGVDVAVDNNTILVGTLRNYFAIFEESGDGSWVETFTRFGPIGSGPMSGFGRAVEISGDLAVVGKNGAAVVFERTNGVWGEAAELTASNGALSGTVGTVAISGETVVATDIASEVAVVFERLNGTWFETAELAPSFRQQGFGASVAIDGDMVVVGATFGDGERSKTGAAFLFSRDAFGDWEQVDRLEAFDGLAGDNFGDSVDISNGMVIAGSWQNDDAGTSSGSAYICGAFERCGSTQAPTEMPTAAPTASPSPRPTGAPTTSAPTGTPSSSESSVAPLALGVTGGVGGFILLVAAVVILQRRASRPSPFSASSANGVLKSYTGDLDLPIAVEVSTTGPTSYYAEVVPEK